MILNKGHLWCFSHKILKNHIFYVLYLFAPEYQKNSLILAVLFAQTLFLNVWHFMKCHEVELKRKISSNILQLIWLILIRSLTLLGMKRGKCISNPKICKVPYLNTHKSKNPMWNSQSQKWKNSIPCWIIKLFRLFFVKPSQIHLHFLRSIFTFLVEETREK